MSERRDTAQGQMGITLGGALVLALACLVGAATPLSAQIGGVDLGPSSQNEKFPTPRDPSYVAPLLPETDLDAAGGGGDASLLLGFTGGGDLVSIFAQRQQAQQEAARRANRYGERNDQYLDETGQDQAFLEQGLLRQFSARASFPRGFGRDHYTETPGRRAGIVFLLALPITSAFLGGLYELLGPGIQVNGPADYPGLLGILAGGSVFAGWIAYYDYTQTSADREHAVGHRAREVYRLRNHPFGRRGVSGESDGPDSQPGNASDQTQGDPAADPLTLDSRRAAMHEATRALGSRADYGLDHADRAAYQGGNGLPVPLRFSLTLPF